MACVAPSGAAARIAGSRAARQEGNALADRLLGVNGYAAEPDARLRRDADSESFSPYLQCSCCSGCGCLAP